MLFDLDRHKVRVGLEMLITAASGGAIAAIVAAFTDPAHFNFSIEGLKDLARVAGGGAFTGILFLLRSLPRNPTSYERRQDAPQVEKAAVKLVEQGTIPPILPKP